MSEMQLADMFEAMCDLHPARPALVHGDLRRSWGEFDERAARLAAAMAAYGVGRGDTVAIAMYNCSEWLEAFYGAIKLRAVPANVNYRYQDEEMLQILQDGDARALFFHASLADAMLRIRPRLPHVRMWVMVDDVDFPESVEAVERYETLIDGHAPAPRIARSADDCFLSYTGGTTGLPRGVVSALSAKLISRYPNAVFGKSYTDDDDALAVATELYREGSHVTVLVAPPLMHATGLQTGALPTLALGGTVVTLASTSFDPHLTLAEIERNDANRLVIVGDAFARPLADALEAGKPGGGRYQCPSLRLINSTGAAWTAVTKKRMLACLPHVKLMESCGASEGVSYGVIVTGKGDDVTTGSFMPAAQLLLLDDNFEPLPREPGTMGLLAAPCKNAGYLNDSEKTARTFRTIGGMLYGVPGDYGRLEEDGTLTLLGRGSAVVNTGGEKVYPDEVEDVINQAEGVVDSLVIGLPDERFGQKVAAVVQVEPGTDGVAEGIIAHVKEHLAHYKAPRDVVFVPVVPRVPNGKGDYKLATRLAMEALGAG